MQDDEGRPALAPEGELATSPPSGVAQLDAALSTALRQGSAESRLGFGMFKWLGESLRLRWGLEVTLGTPISKASRSPSYLGAAPVAYCDWALGERRQLGRYPGLALTAYASPGVHADLSSRVSPRFRFRAGAGITYVNVALLGGVAQIAGRDRAPVWDVSAMYSAITN